MTKRADQKAARRELDVADEHLRELERAETAPPDWTEIGFRALYALESAVRAAAIIFGASAGGLHLQIAERAQRLTEDEGLPAVARLLQDLVIIRRDADYGTTDMIDQYNPKEIVETVREYIDAVDDVVGG